MEQPFLLVPPSLVFCPMNHVMLLVLIHCCCFMINMMAPSENVTEDKRGRGTRMFSYGCSEASNVAQQHAQCTVLFLTHGLLCFHSTSIMHQALLVSKPGQNTISSRSHLFDLHHNSNTGKH